MSRGRFIAFEGGEGSGKSTQAAKLAEHLGAVLTREPGGTALGRAVRGLVLGIPNENEPDANPTPLDPRAEALLMLADRAQHVAEVIRPALAAGRDVVTDRFSGSTLAYQGHGRGLDIGELSMLSSWAAAGLDPDVVFLLDLDAEVSATRRCRPLDRIEAQGVEFHRRVVEGYLKVAAADPGRWVVVDGLGIIDEVGARIAEAFRRWAESRP